MWTRVNIVSHHEMKSHDEVEANRESRFAFILKLWYSPSYFDWISLNRKLEINTYLIFKVCSRVTSNHWYQRVFMYSILPLIFRLMSCLKAFFEAMRSSKAWSMISVILALSAQLKEVEEASSNSTSNELKSSWFMMTDSELERVRCSWWMNDDERRWGEMCEKYDECDDVKITRDIWEVVASRLGKNVSCASLMKNEGSHYTDVSMYYRYRLLQEDWASE